MRAALLTLVFGLLVSYPILSMCRPDKDQQNTDFFGVESTNQEGDHNTKTDVVGVKGIQAAVPVNADAVPIEESALPIASSGTKTI